MPVKHAVVPIASPLPVATGDYPALGHAADFSWISGRIERDLSCTYLRFGSPKDAPWGGRILIVAPPGSGDPFQPGDNVVLKGSITRLAFGTCGAPAFMVSGIEEH